MKKNKTRKVVFFLVEGPTDKLALENIFKKIYKNNKEITFEFTNGDITSDDIINIDNICDAIYDKLNAYMKDKKLRKNDIWEIVQICDIDGAYIPDSEILQGITKEFVYTTQNIYCKNIEKVIERNKGKREKMDYLISINDIKGIPYRCFYMSRNLEHALYNKVDVDDDEKSEIAYKFYEAFLGDEKRFITFIDEKVVNGISENYEKSWREIKEGVCSLERHTNIHIYFKNNPYNFF